MPMAEGYAVAPRPFADILAIAAAELVTLTVDVVDDIAFFRPFCLDCGSRDLANFRRNKHRAALKGSAGEGCGHCRQPKNRYDGDCANGHQRLPANPHDFTFQFGDSRLLNCEMRRPNPPVVATVAQTRIA